MTWVEFGSKHVSVIGIAIVKDNPITIGAWNVLNTYNPNESKLVMWIEETRYTYGLLDKVDKFSFNLPAEPDDLVYCGRESGEDTNKLSNIKTGHKNGYTVIPDSDYIFLCEIEKTVDIGRHKLVISKIVDHVRNRDEEWVEVGTWE